MRDLPTCVGLPPPPEFCSDLSVQQVDLSHIGKTEYQGFSVEVIDSLADYVELMKQVFDFAALRRLLARPGFKCLFDSMHGGTFYHSCFGDPYPVRCLQSPGRTCGVSLWRSLVLPPTAACTQYRFLTLASSYPLTCTCRINANG